ncbi:MAG: hypothetical protein WKF42_04200 [Solirubrobacteraceae bacterium]
MSSRSPEHGQPIAVPAAGSLRCPRCSATVGPNQDWCLECGAPARTRLAPTPNWQLPTVALGALLLIAGALFAFAFVKLTDDGGVPASAPATVTTAAPAVPPAVVAPPPPAGTPPPAEPTPPPGATAPPAAETTPPPAATTGTTPGQTAPPTTPEVPPSP